MAVLIASCRNRRADLHCAIWKVYRSVKDPVNFFKAGLQHAGTHSLAMLVSHDGGLTFHDELFTSASQLAQHLGK